MFVSMSDIGDLIQRERERRGWTRRQLAAFSDVSHVTINKIEKGTTARPSIPILRKIADALHIDEAPLIVAAGYLEPAEEIVKAARVLPIIGEIKGGAPGLALAEREGEMEVTEDIIRRGASYALHVRGDSMERAGIVEGSVVYVRPATDLPSGKVAVVMVGNEEACVKRIRYDDDSIVLQSANPAYPDQRYRRDRVTILGEVVGIFTDPFSVKSKPH
jgi:SOS-response transcriptional repressor LexA